MPRSAKECQEMPTDTKSLERPGKIVPRGLEGAWPCPYLDFWMASLLNCEIMNTFLLLEPPRLWSFVTAANTAPDDSLGGGYTSVALPAKLRGMWSPESHLQASSLLTQHEDRAAGPALALRCRPVGTGASELGLHPSPLPPPSP